jgi:AcrR family transcriptional regulator
MVNPHKDRRVKRTRRALQKALISLILEDGYDSVTIEEITDRADLGRTTFYLHFKDKEELFMHAIDTICEDFIKRHETLLRLADTSETTINNIRVNLDERILYQVFSHAQDNADLYKVMLRGEGGTKASRRFSTIIQNETIHRLNKIDRLVSKVPLEVFAVFFSGTLIEMVTWWLENGQPFSIEEMVRHYQQLLIVGAKGTLQMAE